MKPPFPYFGGKRNVAGVVWERLGLDADVYTEPFAGSLAVLLARPGGAARWETVNDIDGCLTNFWRAVRADPDQVAKIADYPVSEIDLHARHAYLIRGRADLTEKLIADPHYYDVERAAWWVWGACLWLGGGWCADSSMCVNQEGSKKQIPQINQNNGVGLAMREAPETRRQIPALNQNAQTGINTRSVCTTSGGVLRWFNELADRLRHVRICCGDFARVLTPTVTENMGGSGVTAVFLDPPYCQATAGRNNNLYAMETESSTPAREWAIAHGDDHRYRIAICGYDGEHDMPDGWDCYEWTARGGYGNAGKGATIAKANRKRERIWFSPHCLKPRQSSLFGADG